ncbi:LysM peptidoglycan-binding domain-containing protein [Paenibacillus sp. BC26]|uniref:LysM peptidoglycan-binding domain-containing protein n=1 Tax=Paenibacillus sp. BC26 TaxID=1881032 RepID=UPI0008E97F47|nr:LysM peptidoglycan-binding domain-containing protein [Paenibacillus sp. BC26]SFS70847.1 LysM domain-containing protein [Paenibacillus sp. BC26]
MIYVVQGGDTLERIADRFGSSVARLLEVNVICDPQMILVGQPLLIPDAGIDYQRAGGYPYYVVQYGDHLTCLAPQFHQSPAALAASNRLSTDDPLTVGSELLAGFTAPDPVRLASEWANTATSPECDLNSMQQHGIYYIGSFQWETLGEAAVPFLVPLLKHACETVRYYTVMSLGRIATGDATRAALESATQDQTPYVAELARLALRRAKLVPEVTKRVHLLTADQRLYAEPSGSSASIPLPAGTEIFSMRWNIPSGTNEEGPRGGLEYYDQVQVRSTGQVGYLGRVGFNDAELI